MGQAETRNITVVEDVCGPEWGSKYLSTLAPVSFLLTDCSSRGTMDSPALPQPGREYSPGATATVVAVSYFSTQPLIRPAPVQTCIF
jgi:hypothetical protein